VAGGFWTVQVGMDPLLINTEGGQLTAAGPQTTLGDHEGGPAPMVATAGTTKTRLVDDPEGVGCSAASWASSST